MWRYNFDDAFHGAKAQTNCQEVSIILSFVNKIMTNEVFKNSQQCQQLTRVCPFDQSDDDVTSAEHSALTKTGRNLK